MTLGSAVVSSCALRTLRAFPVYSRAALIERLPGQFQIVADNIHRLVECMVASAGGRGYEIPTLEFFRKQER